jgi:hypothetical protein
VNPGGDSVSADGGSVPVPAFCGREPGSATAKDSNHHVARELEFGVDPHQALVMKILTDDPDWKREVYEARALAMRFVGSHGRAMRSAHGLQAVGNGLTVTFQPTRSPLQLTVDTSGARVLSIEWHDGDAWRLTIETYHSGQWESRLKAAVYPRPWLARCRSLVTFTGSLPPTPRRLTVADTD